MTRRYRLDLNGKNALQLNHEVPIPKYMIDDNKCDVDEM